MTLEQYLLSAVISLAGCVGGLFAWFKANFATVEGKLANCEEDRERLWERVAQVEATKKDKTEHFGPGNLPIPRDKRRNKRHIKRR